MDYVISSVKKKDFLLEKVFLGWLRTDFLPFAYYKIK